MNLNRPAVARALKLHVQRLRRERDNLLRFAKNYREVVAERERRAAELTLQIVALEAEIAAHDGTPAPFP